MRRIKSRGLEKHLDEKVAFAFGNNISEIYDALIENETNDVETGILLKDDSGFYVKVRKRRGSEISHIRCIRQYDEIAMKAKKPGGKDDVRFYEVDL